MKGSIATKAKKKKNVMAIVTSLLVFSTQSAGAEEVIQFDDVSVTASRIETKVSETPASITTIGREEIDKVKFTEPKELLDRIPGVSMVRNLRIPFGGKPYTVNLVDGMTVGPAGGRTEFIEDVNTFDIEKIEVVRGPASALYGSNALGGVINVITRDAPEVPEYRVWGELGEYKRSRGGISTAGTTKGGLGYFADINHLQFDGWRENSRHDREAGSFKLIHKPDDKSKLTLRAEYYEMFREAPATLTKAEYDADWRQSGVPTNDTFSDSESLTLALKYERELNDASGFEVAYTVRDKDATDNPTVSYKDPGTSEDTYHTVLALYNKELGYMNSRLIAGLDIRRGTEENEAVDDFYNPTIIEASWDIEAEITSPFVQYEISPVEKTKITLGGRYDKTEYDAEDRLTSTTTNKDYSDFTAKAGITYEINPDNSIWFSYSEGFVVPTTSSLFTASNPNPNLDPEEAQNYEIGLRGKALNKKLKYDIAFYDMDIEDMVVGYRVGWVTTYTNAGEVSIRGVETTLGYEVSKHLNFDISHTYTKNKYDEYETGALAVYDGNDVRASPDHHWNARAVVSPVELLDVELEMDYISRYHTDDANTTSYKRPTLYHLRAAYDTGVWSAWLHIKNLANRKYAKRVLTSATSESYYVGSPRSVYAGASYTW